MYDLSVFHLIENHLAFIAAHRGSVYVTPQAIEVVGAADFLSLWSPRGLEAVLPNDAGTVRLFGHNDARWPGILRSKGFTEQETLVYMTTPIQATTAEPGPSHVSTVASDTDAVVFAEVQADAFLENHDPHKQWWMETFRDAALRNYNAPDQIFYIARVDGKPAAVSLTIRTGNLFGVYAVGTRPRYRRRGLVGDLLNRARIDAASLSGATMTLQVGSGSAAERLYRKLGFTEAATATDYTRGALV